MLRRTAVLIALAALIAPAAGRANEWEEDYSSGDEQAPDEDYRVSVDMDAPSASVSIDTFEGSLSPYGDWVAAGNYGRVWRPHVAAGWRPYYYGRWEWTNEGWLWVSDEPWGWAAYHYGRWAMDPYYGWIWVPGYQWAPAWVSWRYSGDVIGWAPLAPGVSVFVSATPFVSAWWTFVPCQSFVSVPVYRAAFAPAYTRRYFDATVPAPARPGARPAPGRPAVTPAWGGPPPRTIEQRIGRPVTPVRIVAAPTPGAAHTASPGEVSIYRPELRGGGFRPGTGQRPEVRSFPGGSGPAHAPAPAVPRQNLPVERPSFRGGATNGPPSPPEPGAQGDRARFKGWQGQVPGRAALPGSTGTAGPEVHPSFGAPQPAGTVKPAPSFPGGARARTQNGGARRPEVHLDRRDRGR